MKNLSDGKLNEEIAALRRTLRTLRSKRGCPWDREQKLQDIISYLVEEAYELRVAERRGRWKEIEEELGDIVFLAIFAHELILDERKTLLSTIVRRVHRKIVRRHPHVFGKAKAKTSEEGLAEWERKKRKERKLLAKQSIVDDPVDSLPPFQRAAAVQKAASGMGFDWPDVSGILEKLEEETTELRKELSSENRAAVKEELGDLLFTLVNLARRLGIDAESALDRSTSKFVRRFREMQRRSRIGLSSMSLDEMESLWQRIKKNRRPKAIRRRP